MKNKISETDSETEQIRFLRVQTSMVFHLNGHMQVLIQTLVFTVRILFQQWRYYYEVVFLICNDFQSCLPLP